MKVDLDTCGCCGSAAPAGACGCPAGSGSGVRPGLSALPYRSGTHAAFLDAMKAAMHRQSGLLTLAARDPADPAIALLDAWAMVLDVLAFYNERMINEGYLRTATERASVLELAAEIGYQLGPGVAASTYLAFELESAKGAPAWTQIDPGTRAQSLPGPGERPQVFETIAPIRARPTFNALRPRLDYSSLAPEAGANTIYLSGATTGLKQGDPLLIFFGLPAATSCDLRSVRSVDRVDLTPSLTVSAVGLDAPVGTGTFSGPTGLTPAVYVLRQQAALFGHNAPEWKAMPPGFRLDYSASAKEFKDTKTSSQAKKTTVPTEWPGFTLTGVSGNAKVVVLDALYPRILQGSWLVLSDVDQGQAFQVSAVTQAGLSRFTISAQATQVTLGDPASTFNTRLRDTVVRAESHPLALAGPRFDAVQGTIVTLSSGCEVLERGRALAFRGRRAQVLVAPAGDGLTAVGDAGGSFTLHSGERLVVDRPYHDVAGTRTWYLRRPDGAVASLNLAATSAALRFVPAGEDVEPVTEVVGLDRLDTSDPLHATLWLASDLVNSYDRLNLVISANVAPATHGETRHEVLGSGDASLPFQRFTLKQAPLTYVQGSTAKGAESTLQVRVNGIGWRELPSFYRQDRRERGFVVRIADNRSATIEFGDGMTGVRLPSGVENVTATYRSGIGLEGNVRAGQVGLLQTRPLGVRSVTNPVPASGAADPEPMSQARRNAPVTVVTFDRVVSLTDFADFASTFSGIGKASAAWLWRDHTALVHVTVAGAGGAAIPEGSPLMRNLAAAIERNGIFRQPFMVQPADAITFAVSAGIYRDPDYEWQAVKTAIRDALLASFFFEARDFAQSVTEGEVLSTMQAVAGVRGVRLFMLVPSAVAVGGVAVGVAPVVVAARARIDGAKVLPAQLLTVEPTKITLTEQK